MILINFWILLICGRRALFFSFFIIIIIVVVARPYADTRDKSGKNAYTVKIEVKK
jgi:hypothetical protein